MFLRTSSPVMTWTTGSFVWTEEYLPSWWSTSQPTLVWISSPPIGWPNCPAIQVWVQVQSGCSSGCTSGSLGSGHLSLPSCASHSQGDQKGERGEDQGSDDLPVLAHSPLVASSIGHVGGASHATSSLQDSSDSLPFPTWIF